MESLGKTDEGFAGNVGTFEEERQRESSSSSDFSVSEATGHEENSHSSAEDSSSTPSADNWPLHSPPCSDALKPKSDERDKQGSSMLEVDMMKERFAKLLLGEDMSGCGNGVNTALAISNAITNLCATLFGQLWRLEPLPSEKKMMWQREMEYLLCVSDHIVALTPTWQTFPDGSKLEVMTCRPRSDLYVNLPALRKLDNMLLDILDSFHGTSEFWYVDKGIVTEEAADGSTSLRKHLQRQEEKWWLPVPSVAAGGISEDARKQLQHRRDSTNQILKAAMAINSITLADMKVPQSYLDNLPKNGRASLGDLIYRYITSDQFSPECLLDCLDLSSEHQAIEIANRVETSIYLWRQKTNSKAHGSLRRSMSKSSWEMVRELMIDVEKKDLLADRAESLLLSLKQRFPGLPQTTLDMSKIQYNKDVGKSILESYSRVLESLAFNIVARIDDLLYVDDLTKHSDNSSSIPRVSLIAHKTVTIQNSAVLPSGTPYKTAFNTPNFSPLKGGERSSFLSSSSKLVNHGFGGKRVLTDYLSSSDVKVKDQACPDYLKANADESNYGNANEKSDTITLQIQEVSAAYAEMKDGVQEIDGAITVSEVSCVTAD